MDEFLQHLQQAPCMGAVPLEILEKCLGSGTGAHAAQEHLYALIDAFSAFSEASPPVGGLPVYQQAVMRSIVVVLKFIRGHQPPFQGCGVGGAVAQGRIGPSCDHDTAEGGAWELSSEDYLMLAMFLGELVTTPDRGLFFELTEAVALCFELSMPLLYGPPPGDGEESRQALKTELGALRVMISRRLRAAPGDARAAWVPFGALECLLRGVWAALRVAPRLHREAAVGLGEDLRAAIGEVLSPLESALQEQLRPLHGAELAKAAPCTSPLLLATLLNRLEDFIWWSGTASPLFREVAERVVGDLLVVVQRYLALQQRRQVDRADPAGAGARGAGDAFRVYNVQRALQHLLSVVLGLPAESAVTEALRRGAAAAVAAFGGPLTVTAPTVSPPHVATAEAAEAAAVAREAARRGWALAAVPPTRRLRGCWAVLTPGSAAEAGVEGGGEALEEEALLLGGALTGREVPLKTTLGLVTATALVDMVLRSVALLERVPEGAIQQWHLQGLEAMQRVAAQKARREERERLRTMERQGVEGIAPGDLMEHVKDGAALRRRGMQALRRPTARAQLAKAAFFSVLRAYEGVEGEAEATVREAQALLARSLVQLPALLADVAEDALLLRVRRELRHEQQRRAEAEKTKAAAEKGAEAEAEAEGEKAEVSLVSRSVSAYQLLLQTLFVYYAALSPVHERAVSSYLGGSEDSTALPSLAGGAATAMWRRVAVLTIQTENPIAFLHEGEETMETVAAGGEGGAVHRKRRRPAEEGSEGSEEERFRFRADTSTAPSPYSHLLCRTLELVAEAKLHGLLLDVLLQAPALTVYVWNYLYRSFCLSPDKTRCVVGMWLLTNLATRRAVYRSSAVNLLVHLCTSTNEYARRLSIKQVGTLLTPPAGADARPVMNEEAESLLIRYAKMQLAAIPACRVGPSEGGRATADAAAPAREVKKVRDLVNRHLGLFLMLCARQPRQLFASLLDVFKLCVEQNNVAMVQLLLENMDIRRMTQHLVKTDMTEFITSVMPFMRRYSTTAALLVQAMLSWISEGLREVCTQRASAAGSEGGDDGLRRMALALLGHAKAMYEMSSIPLAAGEGALESPATLHDVRFVAPFLSLIGSDELRRTYMPAFLYFVQVQLQFQRRYQHSIGTLTSGERSYVLETGELHSFVKSVIRESVVRTLVPFTDGVARGLSRVDFFVYLHRAPQETRRTSPARASVEAAHAGRGVLDAPDVGDAAVHRGGRPESERRVPLPPISVLTTKEVITLCFELSRTFDHTTVEKLYGPEEVQKAIKKMMHPLPVPTQLMATVITAASLFVRGHPSDFLRFVVQFVLGPLGRASVWESDAQLWKGVLVFVERYYRECGAFLVNLPDHVLAQALRGHPTLYEYFKEEHGSNASFGHLLGTL